MQTDADDISDIAEDEDTHVIRTANVPERCLAASVRREEFEIVRGKLRIRGNEAFCVGGRQQVDPAACDLSWEFGKSDCPRPARKNRRL